MLCNELSVNACMVSMMPLVSYRRHVRSYCLSYYGIN
jgi:hypothetical protein